MGKGSLALSALGRVEIIQLVLGLGIFVELGSAIEREPSGPVSETLVFPSKLETPVCAAKFVSNV